MAKLNVKVFGFNVSAEISKAKTSDEVSQEIAGSIRKAVTKALRDNKRQGGLLRDP